MTTSTTATTAPRPSPLDGLPTDGCVGNTIETDRCLGAARDARAALLRERIEIELARIDDLMADPTADDVRYGLLREQQATLQRASAGWPALVDDLCTGSRGFDGTWSSIDVATCEIEIIESMLWQIWSFQSHHGDD